MQVTNYADNALCLPYELFAAMAANTPFRTLDFEDLFARMVSAYTFRRRIPQES